MPALSIDETTAIIGAELVIDEFDQWRIPANAKLLSSNLSCCWYDFSADLPE